MRWKSEGSREAGFLGGVVFPILFVGGTATILVHSAVDDIPVSLAVAAMLAAFPRAIIGVPVSFILIGAGGVGLGVAAIAPVAIAVVASHLTVSALKLFVETRKDM